MFTIISSTNMLYHLFVIIFLIDRDGISWVGGSYRILPYSIVLGSGYTRDSPTLEGVRKEISCLTFPTKDRLKSPQK